VNACETKVALVSQWATFSYGGLWDKVLAVAECWRTCGVAAEDVVILHDLKPVDLVIEVFSIWAAGATAYLVPARAGALEHAICQRPQRVRWIVSGNGAHLVRLIGSGPVAPRDWSGSILYIAKINGEAGEGVRDAGNDVLWMMSSGTTGRFKTAQMSATGCAANAQYNVAALGLTERDVSLLVLPVSYSYSFVGQILSHLVAGATIMVPSTTFGCVFNFGEIASRYGVTNTFLVPALARQIVRSAWRGNECRSAEGLRLVTIGGDTMDPLHFQRLGEIVSNGRLGITYGLVEAGPRVTTGYPSLEEICKGFVGFPLQSTEVFVSSCSRVKNEAPNVGLIRIAAPSIAVGYAEDELTLSLDNNGLLITTDVGLLDERGALFLKGRLEDEVTFKGHLMNLNELRRRVCSTDGVIDARVEVLREAVEIRLAVASNTCVDRDKVMARCVDGLPLRIRDIHLIVGGVSILSKRR
jgi:acyl-coenzyme A synthetase/AMP-(fatty) acid ligase